MVKNGVSFQCSHPQVPTSAFLTALQDPKRHAIAILLLERASPDVSFVSASGYTALHGSSAEMCKRFLDLGAVKVIDSVANFGHTALYDADTEKTKLLVDYGADSSIRTNEGQTPLLNAVWRRDYGVMKLLLERSTAEVDVTNNYGETPLTVAFAMGDEKSMAMLMTAGALVD